MSEDSNSSQPSGHGDKNRFCKSDRLRLTREFRKVQQSGKKAVSRFVVANWNESVESGTARLGVISSRKVGGAVQRNRARRLLREAFRSCRSQLSEPVDLVLVARRGIHRRKSHEIASELMGILRKNRALDSGSDRDRGSK